MIYSQNGFSLFLDLFLKRFHLIKVLLLIYHHFCP